MPGLWLSKFSDIYRISGMDRHFFTENCSVKKDNFRNGGNLVFGQRLCLLILIKSV